MPYKDVKKRRAAVRASMQKKRAGDAAYVQHEKEVKRATARARPFIGIDGEGVTREDGRHDYVLLLASTGESICEPAGLSSVQCFEFLLKLHADHPNAIFCGFGLSYDVTKWLRDLGRRTLGRIHDNKAQWNAVTRWRDPESGRWYGVGYVPRKYVAIYRYAKSRGAIRDVHHRDGTVEGQWQSDYEAKITIYDTIGFFQGRFVDVLAKWFDPTPDDLLIIDEGRSIIDLAAMRAMKNARNSFTAAQLEREILPYCRSEVVALAALMERLRDTLESVGLHLSRWHGAGEAAAAILKQHDLKAAMIEDRPNDALLDAQRRAYAGGRFELGQIGTYIGPMYNYDIRSAYPSIMPELPWLTDGLWRHTKGASDRPYSLSRVRWQFEQGLRYYPFFYRDNDGSIYFPHAGEGWYWKPEIDAARRAHEAGGLPGTLEVIESWEFAPTNPTKPLAFVADLYAERRRMKAEGHPGEKVLKFAINSLYGKQSQSAGGSEEHHPTFHNIGYAGYVTSAIRAKVFDALMQAPESIIQITADGLYSTEPLDLPVGDGLGQWELSKLDGGVFVQAGVYWSLTELGREPTDEERRSDGFAEKFLLYAGQWYAVNPHYRGYDKGAVTAQTVIDGWRAYATAQLRDERRDLTVPATRFITLGSAFAPNSGEYFERLGQWHTIERSLALLPTMKRIFSVLENGGKKPRLHKQLYWTQAAKPLRYDLFRGTDDMSAPYYPKWARGEAYSELDGVDQAVVDQEIEDSQL